MQLILQVLMLSLLGMIVIQDICYRAVSWLIFPLFFLDVVVLRFRSAGSLEMVYQPALINIGLLLVIFLLLTLYVLVRYRQLVNITDQYLGSGDVLFLLVTACYLSVLNFLLFFVFSLICTGLLQLIWQQFRKNKYIPLAGLQAFFLIFFLSGDWWYFHHGLTDDNWLLQWYTPWIQS